MVFIILIVLVTSGGVWLLHENRSPRFEWASAPLRRLSHYFKTKMRSVGCVVKMKAAITFCQVVASIDKAYAVQLPPAWYQWTAWITFIGELDWLGWAVPAEARS